MAFRAVVIGPARYAEDSGIDSHPSIGASAQMYGETLAADGMWGPDSCRVLGEDEVQTTDGVMRALQQAADETTPQDIFLVVYVGHGQYWSDLPGAQVHFSVGRSFRDKPWTWLSSWYVYRVMRKARARLKVLIADCCYSNLLPQLGEEPLLPGVLGELDEGTCVFTAVKNLNFADAAGCPSLPGDLAQCTPFSGHLLRILQNGTKDHNHQLTIGLLREAVKQEMERCPTARHQVPRMSLNDARDGTPLFTNHMEPARRDLAPRLPVAPEDWVRTLLLDRDDRLEELLKDAQKTGAVVALLNGAPDEASRHLAGYIDDRANSAFTEPRAFARYWNQVDRALRV
ncbi:hypothetical protein SAMN06272735_5603 [Streptomyces sp. TLI_55]|uniref:caspase family protein n=1 Tax=Streptomyces sp. TLI_55 TaxID=1938861 RepID=UPI000BC70745|nr:caspase family protein [Streptomyces sp. TLI_55]SNX63791.1 hypothetical protein SAMN06272735_5603 [Streptomyces sp. TLI_55]